MAFGCRCDKRVKQTYEPFICPDCVEGIHKLWCLMEDKCPVCDCYYDTDNANETLFHNSGLCLKNDVWSKSI